MMDRIDPGNAVVRLCIRGMDLEQQRRIDEARAAFEEAWRVSTNDYEACIAAHFLARHQPEPADRMAWNGEALRRAEASGDGRTRGFMASLLLNFGFDHECLGNHAEAIEMYRSARACLSSAGQGPYADMLASGIDRGIARIEEIVSQETTPGRESHGSNLAHP